MDQRTTTIDQDLKDIVDTRVAISEKLELLEQRIRDTAEGATMKFSRMLDETSQSVNQMVDKTKAALDPVHKVDEYPWLMLGGAVAAGFLIGLMDVRIEAACTPIIPPARTPRTSCRRKGDKNRPNQAGERESTNIIHLDRRPEGRPSANRRACGTAS
jgi:ElaB/YqjD/DUF883 family membrane-anchored ribosome-binding protein